MKQITISKFCYSSDLSFLKEWVKRFKKCYDLDFQRAHGKAMGDDQHAIGSNSIHRADSNDILERDASNDGKLEIIY